LGKHRLSTGLRTWFSWVEHWFQYRVQCWGWLEQHSGLNFRLGGELRPEYWESNLDCARAALERVNTRAAVGSALGI
jgi:hypothetical protein